MNIALIVASNNFQSIEYDVPKNLFEQQGFSITTVSDKKGTIHGHDESTTTAQQTLSDMNPEDFDAIVFIGGPGALEHLDNEKSYEILEQAIEAKKIVAAICVSTRILAKAGILKGKDATGWNGDNQLPALYKEMDVNYKPQDVIVDNNIVTAVGPAAAREFAENIISLLMKQNQ